MLTSPWRKVVRDVWRERSRASLAIVAIAVGLAGLLAVLVPYAVLDREMRDGYLATNPASAVLHTDAIDDETLAAVLARADVRDADAGRLLTGRFRTGTGNWRRMLLFVVRDFGALRINRVSRDRGAWPPGEGELLIERDAVQVAKVPVGTDVTIEISEGEPHTLRFTGVVHDAGQAQARMENMVYAYVTPATLARLTGRATLDRLHIVVEGDARDVAHIRTVAETVKEWLEAGGHVVRQIDVPPPGEHPHARIMNLLLMTMAVFGLLVLILSGVIVVNLLLSMMARERRQIGVMKAIGGTRGQIAAIYLAEAAAFGLAAVALATPFGLLGGRVLSQRLATLLNFDLVSLDVPVWVFAAVGLIGVVVPLVAAAYPVAAATSWTVQAALAPTDLSTATFVPGRIDRALVRMSGPWRPLLLGVRNCLRRRTRTALTVLTLTIAGAFFMSALNVRSSMIATLDARFGPGSSGSEARYAFDQHMLMIYVFLLVVSGVLALVGGLGLMTTTGLNVLDRRREIGVLRTIGATPAMVRSIVIVESMFVAVLAALLAMAVTWPLSAGVGRMLMALLFPRGIQIALDWQGMAGWLLFSVVLGALSSVVPAVAAARRSIREVTSHE